ncbi:MAG: F0F1 ATP synthase subunit alpha [Anaerolineae bacterium]|jgi:F-type H+-transporting ATPase subunit alpha
MSNESTRPTRGSPVDSADATQGPTPSGPLGRLYESFARVCGNGEPPIHPEDMTLMPPTSLTSVPLWGTGETPLPGPGSGFYARMRRNAETTLKDLLGNMGTVSASTRAGLRIQPVGTVKQVGEGVASVWGLPQATTDELLLFPNSVLGLVMNLDEHQADCILLGSAEGIQGGDIVWATSQRATVPVGERLLGRIVSPLGTPLDGKGPLYIDARRLIESEAVGVVEREPVSVPLHTGVKAVDAMIPIGRGQRELIIGDRQTGKTAIALDTIINQRDTGVLCVYVCIGQRASAVLQSVRILEEADALSHTIVVVAAPDDPPALLYLAPYAGVAMAEAFMDEGRDVLIVYDDLSKHADAYREISLLLRRPPGREAYPGDVFYLHSRLLERACRRSEAAGGGSITALPIVETRRGNISAYIPTNLISITDGQIYLDPDLFNQGTKPAIDIGQSVSRVGGSAQTAAMRRVSGQLRLTLSQYEEVAHFARFGTEIDRATRQQLVRGERLRAVLQQPPYEPLELTRQVVTLLAVDLGMLDDIAVADVQRYSDGLWQHVNRTAARALRAVEDELRVTPAAERDLRQAIAQYTEQFS